MSQTNRFLAEIMRIIFKNLKCVLLYIFQRIYFYFKLTAKFWRKIFFSVIYNIIWGKFNNTTMGSQDLSLKFCLCLCILLYVCLCVYAYVCVLMCVCVCLCAYVCMCMSVCLCVYVYVCVHMQICDRFKWLRYEAVNIGNFSGGWDRPLTWIKDICFAKIQQVKRKYHFHFCWLASCQVLVV